MAPLIKRNTSGHLRSSQKERAGQRLGDQPERTALAFYVTTTGVDGLIACDGVAPA